MAAGFISARFRSVVPLRTADAKGWVDIPLSSMQRDGERSPSDAEKRKMRAGPGCTLLPSCIQIKRCGGVYMICRSCVKSCKAGTRGPASVELP